MSSSFRAIGACARQQALRTLLIAASSATRLLLTARSATRGTTGGPARSPSTAGAARQPGPEGVPAQAGAPIAGAAGTSSANTGDHFSSAKAAQLALSTQSIIYTA